MARIEIHCDSVFETSCSLPVSSLLGLLAKIKCSAVTTRGFSQGLRSDSPFG